MEGTIFLKDNKIKRFVWTLQIIAWNLSCSLWTASW